MSERRWRVTRPRPGWKAYERLLDDLLSKRYRELNDVERRLRSTLVAYLGVELQCLWCGRMFKPTKAFQDFCSSGCEERFRWYHIRRPRLKGVPENP